MATTLAYGFFGDIIQQSENWRVFGPARYNLSGFFQFIRNRSYHTQLTITQTDQKYSSSKDERIYSENSSLPLEIKLEGQYRSINCLNMPCRCEKSKYGMSPSVHLGIFYLNIFINNIILN
jgi:ceramide kinase